MNLPLLQPRRPMNGVTIPLADAAPLVLWREWDAEDTHRTVSRNDAVLPLEQHFLRTPGGEVKAPRLECFLSDVPGAAYSYSGERYLASPLTDWLRLLLPRVVDATGSDFDAVFANLYREGHDSIGWHSDDETSSLGPSKWVKIASLSYGVRRTFSLKHKVNPERLNLDLGMGDLLLMGDGVQSRYLHCVPKRPNIQGRRLNLTFRKLVRAI